MTELTKKIVTDNNEFLQPGTILKQQYQIQKILGCGGFGRTYLADDRTLQVPVAVKEFLPDKGITQKRALKEARAAATFFDLETVVGIRDYFEEQDHAYIVMEYVQGVSVRDYVIKKGRMSGKEVLQKIFPLLLSLEKMHERGVIHQDISADNLMLTEQGKFKLIDFGSAGILKEPGTEDRKMQVRRGFASVEQYLTEEQPGPWVDVYAICATMYFMITGIIPQDAIERRICDKLTDLTEMLGIGLAKEQAAIIMKGLALDKEKRIQTVKELREKLSENTAKIMR